MKMKFFAAGIELYKAALRHGAFFPDQVVKLIHQYVAEVDGEVMVCFPELGEYAPCTLTIDEAVVRVKEMYPSVCKNNVKGGSNP